MFDLEIEAAVGEGAKKAKKTLARGGCYQAKHPQSIARHCISGNENVTN